MCSECKVGWVHDASNFRRCIPCENVVDNCLECERNNELGIYECLVCEGDLTANYDRCDSGKIEHCRVVDPVDPSKCHTCHEGTILNDSRTKCVDCSVFGSGCNDCSLDVNDVPETCTNCIEPSVYNPDRMQCEVEGCAQYVLNA